MQRQTLMLCFLSILPEGSTTSDVQVGSEQEPEAALTRETISSETGINLADGNQGRMIN